VNADLLVVDDTAMNLAVLVGILRGAGHRVRVANSGRGALASVQAQTPELILLDITMPDLDGYTVCRELKSNPGTAGIPVLFISALDDTEGKVRAFAEGGVDYIQKPFQAEEVIARVASHLKIGRLQRELEENAERLRAALAALAEASVTDPLTGLSNRRFLLERIDRIVAECLEQRGSLAFFVVDLDHFKKINDRHGHRAGDLALVEAAKRLRAAAADDDIVVRWGGEEFLIVSRVDPGEEARVAAERFRLALSASTTPVGGGKELRLTGSIGFATFPFDTAEPTRLGWNDALNLADEALYVAKRAGRDTWARLKPSGTFDPALLDSLKSEPLAMAARGLVIVESPAPPDRVAAALRDSR
jgi:diguanylate cyclase (GGDEF)-like protein